VSVLVTGYYYSIQGDIYLQRSWNAIKNALQNQAQARPALPPPPQTRPAGKTVLPGKTAKTAKAASPKIAPRAKPKNIPRIAPKATPKPVPKTAVVVRPAQRPKPAGQPKPGPARTVPASVKVPAGLKSAREQKTTIVRPAPRPAQPARPVTAPAARRPAQPTRPAAPVTQKQAQSARPAQPTRPVSVPVTQRPAQPARPAQPTRPVSAPVTQRPAQPTRPAVTPVQPAKPAPPARPAQPARPAPLFAPLVPASPPPKPRKQKVFSTSLEKARGSVSDRLKKLSGRSYDVYQDRFLAKARNAIRKVLGARKGLFFNLPEEAEDLVFGFLRDNYSNPYMNWEDSAERKNLLSMGFDLPSIVPVIDECYRNL
jgi:hypothetical protein